MKIKEIKKNGVFCWCPTSATRRIAIAPSKHQFHDNLSDSKLEIYDLDIKNWCEEAISVCSVESRHTFNCISWLSDRALITATQSNTLQAYNTENEKLQLVSETDAQSSSLTCIDSNRDSQWLTTGCESGTVDVWNLGDSGCLNKSLSLNSNASSNETVNCVKCNKCVNTIIAVASNSNVHIWDIRKSSNTSPIMRVIDNNATSLWGNGPQSLMICRSLEWSESQSTTLVVANSNDANPIIQLWDLRYATCPIKYMRGGHSRGIVSISWNKYDEQLLLSAGKDNTVCVWDPLTASNEETLLASLPYITNEWINSIEWCEWEPSIFAVNSFDGNTAVYNITQSNSMHQTNMKILESFSLNSQYVPQHLQAIQSQSQAILSKAPKWYRVPCRASWGFGGKLVTYGTNIIQTQTQPPQQFVQHLLNIYHVNTDKEFLVRSDKLENALNNGNYLDYCHYKMSEHTDNEQISMAWKLISLHLETDSSKKNENLLELLGFKSSYPEKDNVEGISESTNQLSIQNLDNDIIQNEESFLQSHNIADMIDRQSFNIDISNNSIGSQINESILRGDSSNVIQNCIANKRWTEAILLSCFVAPEYNASTLRHYFNDCLTSDNECWSPLLWCIISAQIANDDEAINIFQQFISKVDLRYWREVLTFIIRESENWDESSTKNILIENLANRLILKYKNSEEKNWLFAAIYCYIIIGDYQNLSQYISAQSFGSDFDQIELMLILQKATDSLFIANKLTSNYAKLLAIEGKLELALKYIDESNELKERIIGNLKPNLITQQKIQSHAFPIAGRAQRASLPAINSITPQSFDTYSGSIPYERSTPSVPLSNTMAAKDLNVLRADQYSRPFDANTNTNLEQIPMGQQYYNQNLEYSQSVTPITPGWNDPPVLPFSRNRRTEQTAIITPILNPLPDTITPATQLSNASTTLSNVSNDKSHMNITKKPSLTPTVETLSPQNQQIYDSFDRLLLNLQQNSNNQALNIRRKLEDSRNKLEALKNKLGSSLQLSDNTINGLSQIANAINHNDFHSALASHANLVSSATFGETAAFLPAIKVLIHLAQQQMQS